MRNATRNPKPFNSAYVTPKIWGSVERKYYTKPTYGLSDPFSPPEYKKEKSGLATRDQGQTSQVFEVARSPSRSCHYALMHVVLIMIS